jgi:hypothetical protein
MGRFIVVVLLLLAIAFIAYKFLLKGGDPRPVEPAAPGAPAAAAGDTPAAKEEAEAVTADDDAKPAVDEITEEEAIEISAEAEVADAAAATTVETDIDPDAVIETEVAETAADVAGEEVKDAAK